MARPLRIAHALCSNRVGGLEQAYINMTIALQTMGHQVVAWIPADAPYLNALSEETPHEPFNPRGFYDLYWQYKARKKLKNQKVDLIITHNSRATSLLGKARFSLDIPQLAFSHSYKHKRIKGADHLVVLTPQMKQHFVHKGFDPRKMHIFPNMLMEFPSQLLPTPEEKSEVCLGFIGRLTVEKGILDLIEALEALRTQGVSCRLRVAGFGDALQQAQQKIKRLNLEDYVQFDGWITDTRAWLAEIDLVVLPSHDESFGIVIMDAQARGRPVVATSTDGGCSQITHDYSGWLAKPADPQSLAKTVNYAITQRARWPEIITAAYEDKKRYRFQNLLPQLEKILSLTQSV